MPETLRDAWTIIAEYIALRVTWLEALWTFSACVGLYFDWTEIVFARDDLRRLHKWKLNGPRTLVARAGIRAGTTFVLIHMIEILVGIFSMAQVAVNPSRPITPQGMIIAFGLILIGLLPTAMVIMNRVDRELLIDEVRARMENGDPTIEALRAAYLVKVEADIDAESKLVVNIEDQIGMEGEG